MFPEDVERAVAEVEGVRAGNVIAFSVDSTRGKEHSWWSPRPRARRTTTFAGRCTTAPPRPPARRRHDIVLVGAGTLPKTSSGKPQRSLCRARYLEDALLPA